MELRDLKTFSVVAGTLSFSQSAKHLNAAQSTISARIASLEEELGVRLFDRMSRRVVLTDAGSRLAGFARRMQDLEQEARAWVAGDSDCGGSLNIRIPETLCVERMDEVVIRFREQFPKVRLSLITCAADGLSADLRQGITDLALVYMDAVVAAELQVELLGVEPLTLVAAPAHPLALREKVDPGGLQAQSLLMTRADCSYRRMFESILAEHRVEPGAGMEFSSIAAMKRCAALGLGIAIAPLRAVREELASGVLVALPWVGDPLQTGILMIWHRDKWVSPALDVFMDLLRAEFRPRQEIEV